jgi:EAL domain-containing protein (putative c-di-GMP-specific phosphodiesterase class I)
MYLLDFDVAAILLSLVTLYHFYSNKRVADRQYRTFAWFCWLVLASSVLGVASSVAINALPRAPVWAVMTTTASFYLAHTAIPMFACGYIMTLAHYGRREAWRVSVIVVPWAASAIIILGSLFRPLVFYVDEAGRYANGPFQALLYGLSGLYLAVALSALLARRRTLSVGNVRSLLVALLLPIVAVVLQRSDPMVPLECFSASISGLFILLTLQDKSERLDGDTGLLNRGSFMEDVRQVRGNDSPCVVVAVHAGDIARLHGHLGQRSFASVLRVFSGWIQSAAGPRSPVYALDEGLYAVILSSDAPGMTEGELALAILNRSRQSWSLDALRLELPVRICILRHPDDGLSAEETLDAIDQLAHLPDDSGGRHTFQARDFETGKRSRETIEGLAFKRQIEGGGLDLWFQPVVRASDGAVEAVEALVGMSMPDGEVVRQSRTVRIAGAVGLLAPLSEAYLASAIAWFGSAAGDALGARSLQARLFDPRCLGPDWALSIERMLGDAGLDPSRLCVELTEQASAEACDELLPGMRRLVEAGASFALDDFGAGYTDLSRILDMPFSIVKLDKRLVRLGLSGTRGWQALAGSVAMFKALGKTIVAEGVETVDDAASLAAMGADLMQGYRFGFPTRAGERIKAYR